MVLLFVCLCLTLGQAAEVVIRQTYNGEQCQGTPVKTEPHKVLGKCYESGQSEAGSKVYSQVGVTAAGDEVEEKTYDNSACTGDFEAKPKMKINECFVPARDAHDEDSKVSEKTVVVKVTKYPIFLTKIFDSQDCSGAPKSIMPDWFPDCVGPDWFPVRTVLRSVATDTVKSYTVAYDMNGKLVEEWKEFASEDCTGPEKEIDSTLLNFNGLCQQDPGGQYYKSVVLIQVEPKTTVAAARSEDDASSGATRMALLPLLMLFLVLCAENVMEVVSC